MGVSGGSRCPLIGQHFFDRDGRGGQGFSDLGSRRAVTIQEITLGPAIGSAGFYGFDNGIPVVIHVDHVLTPVTAPLTGTDIDCGNAQISAFPYAGARIADDAITVVQDR